MLLVVIGKWIKQFVLGRTDVHNLQSSGEPSDNVSFDNVQQLCHLLEDHHMTILELCCLQTIDCSRSSLHKIDHDVLDL